MTPARKHKPGDTPSPQALRAGLEAGLQSLGLVLADAQQRKLLDYLALLQKWNRVYNLTALRQPADMLTHHLLDCLAVVRPLAQHLHGLGLDSALAVTPAAVTPAAAPSSTATATAAATATATAAAAATATAAAAANPHPTPPPTPNPAAAPSAPAAARLLDVGAGAGLPGVVLAICLPGLLVDCVDTVAKKAAFVQQVAVSLGLPNLRGLHARVEELQAAPYDVVSSRAFSSLADLVALTAFHVKPKTGVWMAMKGKQPVEESAMLPPTTKVFHVEPLVVPGLAAERCLVWMRQTPTEQ